LGGEGKKLASGGKEVTAPPWESKLISSLPTKVHLRGEGKSFSLGGEEEKRGELREAVLAVNNTP